MRFYETPNITPCWHATLGDAHAELKTVEAVYRGEYLIKEVEVDTDKAGVLRLLRQEIRSTATGRTWKVTTRGGLQEQPLA